MFELNIVHVFLFVIAVFLLYYLMNNCSCRGNGFNVGGAGGRWRDKPGCDTCAGDIIAAIGTTVGVDETPGVGEVVMGTELITGLVSCGECGVDLDSTMQCMVHDKCHGCKDNEEKLCLCSKDKLCSGEILPAAYLEKNSASPAPKPPPTPGLSSHIKNDCIKSASNVAEKCTKWDSRTGVITSCSNECNDALIPFWNKCADEWNKMEIEKIYKSVQKCIQEH